MTDMYTKAIGEVVRVQLEKMQFGNYTMLEKDLIRNTKVIVTDNVIDPLAEHYIVGLKTEIASRNLEKIEIKYPLDWWQALKERFFPKRALAKYPVKYKQIQYDLKALYPSVDLGEHKGFLYVVKH